MKNLITLILIGLMSGFAFGHDVELRFTENRVEGDLLFIDIDIKATNYDFNLASHSIRAYYDHAALELVDISSQLPEAKYSNCLLYTSPSPRDKRQSRMPSSA